MFLAPNLSEVSQKYSWDVHSIQSHSPVERLQCQIDHRSNIKEGFESDSGLESSSAKLVDLSSSDILGP